MSSNKAKKTVVISARFTPAEREQIARKASEAGSTMSQYARGMILAGRVIQRITPEDAATLRGLAGMGNNLNQLARQANARGYDVAAIELVTTHGQIRGIINKLSDDWKNCKGQLF